MTTISQLLSRDLSKPIEEVIKLDQQDEATVYNEITEYVATDRIKRQYIDVLQKMADAPSDPTEGVGVWISGFFGSGKSSFAKNLGYVVGNRSVLGHPAGQLFIEHLQKQSPNDPQIGKIADLIRFLNARYASQVIMFDVQVDRAVRTATEPIAEIMYTVLLRELDYAQDYDVAELEIELEGEGRLTQFVMACAQKYREQMRNPQPAKSVPITIDTVPPEDYAVWQRVRKGAQRIQRASAVLNAIDPNTYPSPDSWATSLQKGATITIRTLVDRTFELTARRQPGKAVVFIIDEVGQYVARSAEKIENLRAVVEQYGLESKNRVQQGLAPAPVWVMVTSQEKLDEVVAAIDDKRVELAKLQDRFKTRIDMAPADIREVATKRVLAKTPAGAKELKAFYKTHSALLSTHTKLERTQLRSEVSQQEFVQFYPYLPHFVDLSIDIVSGIRLQAGAPRHIGGSNRTIIKQTYEMLVSERTHLKDEPLGTLVTLDRIYDLVEGNLPSEKQRDISEIGRLWPDDPWPARTAKAIALLEYVRTVPRTEANLAALLYRKLGDEAALPHVERAVELLRENQYIRQTEHGWKLQTAQEKSWTAERNALNPTPRERNDILEEQLRSIFQHPNLARYRYQNLRNFRVGVTWNNRALSSARDAQIPLVLANADDIDSFDEICERTQSDSRADPNRNTIFWTFYLTTEIDDLVTELYRSKSMTAKYEQLRAQGRITNEEASSLTNEKSETLRFEHRLRGQLESTLAQGVGFFRGVSKEGASLGAGLGEIFKKLYAFAVPDLYSKLEMGARPVEKSDAQAILKAANLSGLPKLYYHPPDGLELVVKEGVKYVVNLNAPIIKEVADYLAREHSYGNKVTGRSLENHFGGIGYGWELEILWVVMATMLRGGAIEVTYQGRRYRNHLDPNVRVPFSGANAFRSASFAPRKAPDLQTLVAAVRRYEEITGEEVDVEESAIAQAFQAFASSELQALLPLEATVRANNIPVLGADLTEYHNTLETILHSASDDCVNMLAGEGTSFLALRNKVLTIRQATDKKGLAYLDRLRTALRELWPQLQTEGLDGELATDAALIEASLDDGTFYQTSIARDEALARLEDAYRTLYQQRHKERSERYQQAIDAIKAQPDWPQVAPEMQASLLKPLSERACDGDALPPDSFRCPSCHASLSEMASDLAAVDGLRSQVLMRLQTMLAPEEKIERVRVSDVVGLGRSLESNEEVEEALQQLKDYLFKLIAAGVRVILE